MKTTKTMTKTRKAGAKAGKKETAENKVKVRFAQARRLLEELEGMEYLLAQAEAEVSAVTSKRNKLSDAVNQLRIDIKYLTDPTYDPHDS